MLRCNSGIRMRGGFANHNQGTFHEICETESGD